MKICFVNSFYPPWVGGAESYVKNLASALRDRGHAITVYCSDRPLERGEKMEGGIRVVRMSTPLAFYGTPIVVFPPSILVEKFDVLHANFPSPYLASISAYFAMLRRNHSVLTWHNDLPAVSTGAKVLVKIHDEISSAYLEKYDRIIATTNAYAKRSQILSRYEQKVRIIRNGVDTRRFSPNVDGEEIRTLYGLSKNRIALFVGALTTFHAYKGVEVLIRSFSQVARKCDDARLLIVGGGNLLGQYQRLASELSLGDRVIFSGHVSDTALPKYYAVCDLAILPSKDSSEGFGLVLLEAMATGKAVIGSRVGGIVDVIGDGTNGLIVPPGNESSLSEAMIRLFEDAETRNSMGKAGRIFAESLDWSKVVARVEDVYKEIC